MRLVKSICKHCIGGSFFPLSNWLESDDDRWEVDSAVMCPGEVDEYDIDKPPPKWCGYAAEHIVSQEAGP